ncbi:MAG: hypothetical protein AAF517_21905 [Planctomycetota bacterium]
MLDRASTFADREIVRLLKTKFVPVAIDQAYQRRQKDTEGDFYRKIAGQGPRSNFRSTTQGFYIATASGDLLLYNNNRDPSKIRRLMKRKLSEFESSPAKSAATSKVESERVDKRYSPKPPKGGLVLRVRAKVLGGYEPTTDRWRTIMHNALSRDNLWLTAEEQNELTRGVLPEALKRRLARYHLVDNTRGEPPMWKKDEVRQLDLALSKGEIKGKVKLGTSDKKRGFEGSLLGYLRTEKGRVTQFDLVARGEFWGEGRYTKRAPKGRFPFAVVFSLADGSDVADAIPPQGSRGWIDGYLR